MKRSYFVITLCLLGVLSAALAYQTAATPESGVLVQKGIAVCGDNGYVAFASAFSSTPVVLASAQYDGIPYVASASRTSPSGFVVKLVDDEGEAVPRAAVQWIAAGEGTPDAALNVQAGAGFYGDDVRVPFPSPFTSTPAVVTSAQYDGMPYIAGAANTSPTGFNLKLIDHEGRRVSRAWVQWIAVGEGTPTTGVTAQSGVAVLGDNVYTSLDSAAFTSTPVVVAGAERNGAPCVASASGASCDGFNLDVVDCGGQSVSRAQVQWIALGSAEMPTATPVPTPAPTVMPTPTPIPTASPMPTPTPGTGPGALHGVVYLQGRTDYSGVMVVAEPGGASDVTGADGAFWIVGLEEGTYSVNISLPGYLAAHTTGVSVSGGAVVTLAPVTLLAGDVEADGVVDISDLVRLGLNFGKTESPWDTGLSRD